MSDPLLAPPLRPLLTMGDLLRVVPVSRGTLAHLIGSGQLRAIKIGRRLFFSPDDVECFLRSCSSAERPEGTA